MIRIGLVLGAVFAAGVSLAAPMQFGDIEMEVGDLKFSEPTDLENGGKRWTSERLSGSTRTDSIAIIQSPLPADRPELKTDYLAVFERFVRTQKNFAGQSLLSLNLNYGDTQARLLTGSQFAMGAEGKAIATYISAYGVLIGDTTYEVQWFSTGPTQYAEGFKALRAVKVKVGEDWKSISTLPGNAGVYSLLGLPYGVRNSTPFMPEVTPHKDEVEAQVYESRISRQVWNAIFTARKLNDDATETADETRDRLLKHFYGDVTYVITPAGGSRIYRGGEGDNTFLVEARMEEKNGWRTALFIRYKETDAEQVEARPTLVEITSS